MIRRIVIYAVLAAAMMAAPVFAQTPPTAPNDAGDRVVVEGMSIEEAVRSFVDEVGAAPRGHNLARWDGVVCAGAINIKADYAQRLIDQVSLVALAVGLDIGEPGCKPNVLIMANDDGDGLAARLVDDHVRKFQPLDTDGSNLGSKALRRFESNEAPVRWWHVSQQVLADTGAPIKLGSKVPVRRGSRIYGNVREDMASVLIILDTTLIGAVSFSSLADYVAMVSLAQIDAESDTTEFPSVLNLFAGQSNDRTLRMTQWDLDYLIALYAAPGDLAKPKFEQNHITAEMLKQKSASGAAAKD